MIPFNLNYRFPDHLATDHHMMTATEAMANDINTAIEDDFSIIESAEEVVIGHRIEDQISNNYYMLDNYHFN